MTWTGGRGLSIRTWHCTFICWFYVFPRVFRLRVCALSNQHGDSKHGLKLRSKFKHTLPAGHYRVQPQTCHDVPVSQIVPARKVVVGSGIKENRRNTSRAAFGTNQGGWFPRITALQNIWLKLELMFSTFQPSMYDSNVWLCTVQAGVSLLDIHWRFQCNPSSIHSATFWNSDRKDLQYSAIICVKAIL